ncbi:hypothetical protein [Tateyamaria sp. syn59]|uniref:hypothetical protein n=1 Tax=Tateyamaria sp. syn59 TaxID=2576942 RepID=UPI0011BFC419|nr:hypothetical protein [Tateyamaria sp. syn59]
MAKQGLDDQANDSAEKPEGKRARVRRLLLDPLAQDGFRKPAKISDDDFKKALGRLADALAYMSDQSLEVMYDMMRSKGQGKGRDVWPPRATFYAIAEMVEPCPLEKVPSLRGWFRSNAGPVAVETDTLIEVLAYIQTHKKPPMSEGARRQIHHDARERRRFVEAARRHVAEGTATKDERAKLSWLEARHTVALRFVEEGNEMRRDDGQVHDGEVRV